MPAFSRHSPPVSLLPVPAVVFFLFWILLWDSWLTVSFAWMFPWRADVEKFYKLCDPGQYSCFASAFFFLVPLETIRAQCGGLFNPTAFLGVGLHYSIGLLLWRSVKFQCALLS